VSTDTIGENIRGSLLRQYPPFDDLLVELGALEEKALGEKIHGR
jgi:hypothetical protein